MFTFSYYRYFVAILIMFSTAMAFLCRMNLSTAIIVMVNKNNSANSTNQFNWNKKEQGVILGSFFYGYFFMLIIISRLIGIFGPRYLCAIGLFSTGLINLITPFLAGKYLWFVVSRVVMGSLQAGIFPSAIALIAKWIPDQEKGTAISMAYIGGNIGTIIASSLTGFLCKQTGGWPIVFYISGISSLVYSIVYFIFITDNPKTHWIISKAEVLFIQSNTDQTNLDKPKLAVPWLQMIKSPIILSATFAYFSMIWSITMIMLKLPDYMDEVLAIPIDKSGFMGSTMYIAESFR